MQGDEILLEGGFALLEDDALDEMRESANFTIRPGSRRPAGLVNWQQKISLIDAVERPTEGQMKLRFTNFYRPQYEAFQFQVEDPLFPSSSICEGVHQLSRHVLQAWDCH